MRIYCFGDSNTYGYDPRGYFGGRYDRENRWVDLLGKALGAEMINGGENGRCIPRNAVVFPDSEITLILLGSNDLLQGAGVEQVRGRMEQFLRQLPPRPMILLAPPSMKEGTWTGKTSLREDSKALIASYAELAAQLEIPFIDTSKWEIALTFDGVHFTEEGHRQFAQKLAQALCDLT